MKNWFYDEFKQCGVGYSKTEHAEAYDKWHQKFRNFEKEYIEMIDYLSLTDTKNMIMIDLGCGTAFILLYAEKQFKKIRYMMQLMCPKR